jgi:Tfp pilus assembly protein PilV
MKLFSLKKQNGFLMVESLLAILVITIALTAASVMFVQSSKAGGESVEISTATALAQKQMELLKTQPAAYWNGLTPLPQNIAWQDTTQAMPLVKNNISYTVTTTASQAAQDANLVQIIVQVAWSGKTISLISFFTKISL